MNEQAGTVSSHCFHPRRPLLAHLLLVDDDSALLEALAGTLENRLGHFILDTCETGMKALDMVTANHYDTIISDINMPGMGGLKFLVQARKVQPFVPVVLISAHADTATVSKAIEVGAADFIAKPIERNNFILTVRQTLNVSRLRELSKRQTAIITRARDHYGKLVQQLFLADAVQRTKTAQFDRAFRHLGVMDTFLLNVEQRHRQASEHLTIAEEKLQRLALSRLHGTY